MKTLSAIAVCMAFLGMATAQQQFGGTWKLNVERSDFSHPSNWIFTHTYEGPLRMFWRPVSRVDIIVYKDGALTDKMSTTFSEGAQPEVFTMKYVVDGEQTINYPEGREYVSKAKWRDASEGYKLGERRAWRESKRHSELIIKTKPVPWTAADSIEEHWSISEDPNALIIVRYINRVMKQTLVFDRQ